MRTLQVFGFLVILWQNPFVTSTITLHSVLDSIVTRGCKNLENVSPMLRLQKHLFCDYDTTIRPNHLKTITNVSMTLTPKLVEFAEESGTLSLHSFVTLSWPDPQLAWTPADYNGINYIHVKSWHIWTPNICALNSGDMSNDICELPLTQCLIFSKGTVICVPAMKFMFKCDVDYTYWPYDEQQCRVMFGTWSYTGEEVDFQIKRNGTNMNSFENNKKWDFKFISSMKQVKKYDCCPNDTFPRIDYNFSLKRHHGIKHAFHTIPAIALSLLTLIVFWLDVKSVERIMVVSVNFICHILCMFHLHSQLPYNGVNIPNIMVFYSESLVLAAFALILTALLCKLQDMSTEMPNWISFMTTFVLSNRAGRFLILKDEKYKTTSGDVETQENSDLSKTKVIIKESSWRLFAAIVDWLSFFCVILTYVILLIILIPIS